MTYYTVAGILTTVGVYGIVLLRRWGFRIMVYGFMRLSIVTLATLQSFIRDTVLMPLGP